MKHYLPCRYWFILFQRWPIYCNYHYSRPYPHTTSQRRCPQHTLSQSLENTATVSPLPTTVVGAPPHVVFSPCQQLLHPLLFFFTTNCFSSLRRHTLLKHWGTSFLCSSLALLTPSLNDKFVSNALYDFLLACFSSLFLLFFPLSPHFSLLFHSLDQTWSNLIIVTFC